MKPLPLLLLTGASASLAAGLLPTLPSGAGQPDGDAGNKPGKAALQVQQEQWLAGETALPRQPDGHFYADTQIDGQPARMLVDTGASIVALTGEDAAAIGLQWDQADVAPVARGASGPVLGVEVSLRHMAVGGLEAENVPAIIVPEGLGISLLGQSFLSRVGRVEIQGDTLLLGG